MKRLTLALAAVLSTVACATPAHAACSVSVRWADTSYLATALPADAGRALQGGVRPACNDTVVHDAQGNDISPRDPDEPVELHGIAGVPARLAVEFDGRAYLAAGYLPQLPSHPLHRRWSRGREAPDACGRPWWVDATVAVTPSPGPVPVNTRGGRFALLDFNARARVRGLQRDGYPYVSAGRHLRALVRSCSTPLGGRVLYAFRASAVG